MIHLSTFSIVAYDPHESAWGIAVASKFPAVGAVVPWAKAGAGAVATQSYANTSYGPRGLAFMAEGRSAHDTLELLLQEDKQQNQRQAGLIDAEGRSASFTGDGCYAWAGGLTGEYYAIQGNILTGPETIEAMQKAFLETDGDLPVRLFSALLAGDRAGGDRRGRQSAAILVVKPEGGYGGFNDRWIDYRVDDHEDPVPRLGDLIQLHRLYFGTSPESDQLPIEGDVAKQLQELMSRLGYYSGRMHGEYDGSTREALRAFIGNENFEDRTDIEQGRVDRPVFEFLMQKFAK